jgi:hypothetical protein
VRGDMRPLSAYLAAQAKAAAAKIDCDVLVFDIAGFRPGPGGTPAQMARKAAL